MAREAHCRQQVNLWFKQQALNMRRLDQQEETIYALMLQVRGEKARLRKQRTFHQTPLPPVSRNLAFEGVADGVYVTSNSVGLERADGQTYPYFTGLKHNQHTNTCTET